MGQAQQFSRGAVQMEEAGGPGGSLRVEAAAVLAVVLTWLDLMDKSRLYPKGAFSFEPWDRLAVLWFYPQ